MGQLLTIPAERPFLRSLAGGLLREPPECLGDHLILLPSRRACLELRDTFLGLTTAPALLLPRLQPVGEVDLGDLPLPLLADGDADHAPPIDALRRRLLLARLVKARADMPDEQAIRLATALAELLDLVQTERCSLHSLDELIPDGLADHWQEVVRFLGILDEAWPAILADEGAVDPAMWRNARLAAATEALRREPPAGPVIAAGITGTVPAVADLLAAVLELDQGTVVLPGFDPEMEPATYATLGPTHPFFAIRRFLSQVGREPCDVGVWTDLAPARSARPRRELLAEIMRPAATAEAWQRMAPPPDDAFTGIAVVECDSHGAEALLIALRLRHVLESPGRTAALVTPDRQLARRVAAELARFDVAVDDSGGVPLDQTPPGSLFLLTAHALLGDGGPVPLLSALKHPLARGGLAPGMLRRHARRLERRVLRGPRRGRGLEALQAALRDRPQPDLQPLLDWLDSFAAAATPLAEATGLSFPALVEAHIALVEWLAADETGNCAELWAKETGEATRDFLARLIEAAEGEAAPPKSAYPAVLAVLMGGEAVRPRSQSHPRLMILGQLEARLVEADSVVIAGLNEGTWPRTAEPGPWLNHHLRTALGLPPVEFQIGIAAHDLFMAATAFEVLLTRSIKDSGGSPTVPSRWLQRLDTVTRAQGRRDRLALDPDWLIWAKNLDQPIGPVRPCPPPAPCPPAAARPRDLWVTEIETLMRDPYSVYARRILGLRELDALDADPGVREQGAIIHDVLEQFVRTYPTDLPPNPDDELMLMGLEAFRTFGDQPEMQALWWPRFKRIAAWFVAEEVARRGLISRIAAESEGALKLGPDGSYTIRARADRVEVRRSGGLGIADYKTGTIPSLTNIRAGLNPQLPLEAAIAESGGFAGLAGTVEALEHWPVKAGAKAGQIKPAADPADLEGLIAAARDGVTRLFALFADGNTPFFSVPRPEVAPRYNAYEHLARIKEWRGAGD
jgi:ATP-dependent helicase/nuclease subunit B